MIFLLTQTRPGEQERGWMAVPSIYLLLPACLFAVFIFIFFLFPNFFFTIIRYLILSRPCLSRDSTKMAQQWQRRNLLPSIGYLAAPLNLLRAIWESKISRSAEEKNNSFAFISDCIINLTRRPCYRSVNATWVFGISLFFFSFFFFRLERGQICGPRSICAGWQHKKKEAGKMVDGAINNKANIRKRLQHRSLLGGHRTTIPYSFTYAVFPVLIRKQAENKIFWFIRGKNLAIAVILNEN